MAWSDHLASADKATRKALGSSVTYAPAVGSPVTVTGIFDDRHAIGSGPSLEAEGGSAVFLTLADLPADPATDTPTITVGSVAYKVRKVIKDGQGGVLLVLDEVSP